MTPTFNLELLKIARLPAAAVPFLVLFCMTGLPDMVTVPPTVSLALKAPIAPARVVFAVH